ncbi:hypothetical protein C8R47DRAFT_812323 [Mycena vitilis]|nr:hypothetical protein C8R47DRAFT_812323 [Mycena vitilis]
MQLRVCALYGCSRRIAAFNIVLFITSIGGFFGIMLYNHSQRAAAIASVVRLPLPGCPAIYAGIEWALWVPATLYEGILFGFAVFKTFQSTLSILRKDSKVTLYSLHLRDNIAYFFGCVYVPRVYLRYKVVVISELRLFLSSIMWVPFHLYSQRCNNIMYVLSPAHGCRALLCFGC